MTVPVSTWKHLGNGLWTDGQYWSKGEPILGGGALLLAEALPYTVTSDGAVSLELLEIGAGATLTVGADDFTIASSVTGTTSYLDNDGVARVAAGATMTFGGGGNASVLAGQGRLVLAGSTSGPGGVLDIGSSVELTGAGSIKLNAGAKITSSVEANLLNVDDTILGAGLIGGELSLENGRAGVIDANGANGAALVFDFTPVKPALTSAVASDDDFANYGLIETTGAGALTIESDLYDEGALLADSTGALTIADDAVIAGEGEATVAAGGLLVLHEGALELTGGLTIDADGVLKTTTGDLDDVIFGSNATDIETAMVNHGRIEVVQGSSLLLEGDLIQRGGGVLDLLGSTGHTADLVVDGAAEITGGVLQLGSGNTLGNEITSGGDGGYLENDGTIQGAGTIGDGDLVVFNETNGVIDANGSQALTIDFPLQNLNVRASVESEDSAEFLNEGVVETTGSGGLILSGQFFNLGVLDAEGSGKLVIDSDYESEGGAIKVSSGATLVLDPGGNIFDYIIGANSGLSIAAGGIVETVAGGAEAYDDGLVSNLNNSGTIDVATGSGLVAGGIWNNAGTIAIGGAKGSASELEINEQNESGDVGLYPLLTLTGGGALMLTSAYSEIIGGAATGALDNVNDIISGQGEIGTGEDLILENGPNGIIDAAGGTLLLDPTAFDAGTGTSYLHNSGLLEASSGATLEISQSFLNDGKIVAQSGGSVVLEDAVTGFGVVKIKSGGSVQLGGVCDDAIDFVGSGGRLIEDSLDPSATISGFASGDSIRLNALGFDKNHSSFSYVANSAVDPMLGGVLTVSGFDASGHAASQTLALSGNFATAKFSLGDDKFSVGSSGDFGTVVTVS